MKDRIKRYFKKLIKILSLQEMKILPASIAFYIILAIVPILTFVVLIASAFDISIDLVKNLVSNVIPGQASNIIINIISGKGFDQSVGFFNITAIIMATNGTHAIITTSNTLYKIKSKDFIKDRVSSVILLFIIIILFVFLLIVPIFGENIIDIMSNAKIFSKYPDTIVTIFNVIKWPLTILIIYINIKLIYTVAPSKNIKSEDTTYGAIFTTFAWIIATIVFRLYLVHFAQYDIIYGNLSSIIIMMVWLYFLSFIFVLGMAINASRQEEKELYDTQVLEVLKEDTELLKNKSKISHKK